MLKISNQTNYHKLDARHLIEKIKPFSLVQDMVLNINDFEVSLCSIIQQQKTCYTHSFTLPKLIRRAQQKNQALIKACNNKKRQIRSVYDFTAGWGKDSFMLAYQGQQVLMIEQNILLSACLEYLLEIASKQHDKDCYQRMQVIHQNSLEFISSAHSKTPDCVYLDPMFPPHKSSAKPSKDLQLLQLLTENQDVEALFDKSLEFATHRVVVKRPVHAPALTQIKPDLVLREKTIRFDVYITNNQ